MSGCGYLLLRGVCSGSVNHVGVLRRHEFFVVFEFVVVSHSRNRLEVVVGATAQSVEKAGLSREHNMRHRCPKKHRESGGRSFEMAILSLGVLAGNLCRLAGLPKSCGIRAL